MARKQASCEFCGRVFRPDRYNVHHQRCCGDRECVRERERRRKRRWQARKRREDAAFRQRENARCAAANRRRRASAADSSGGPVAESAAESARLPDVVMGLVAQLTDTSDRRRLLNSIRAYEDRGRMLAGGSAWGRSPPGV